MVTCKKCGNGLSNDSVFCSKCGNRLEEDEGFIEIEKNPSTIEFNLEKNRKIKKLRIVVIAVIVFGIMLIGYFDYYNSQIKSAEAYCSEKKYFEAHEAIKNLATLPNDKELVNKLRAIELPAFYLHEAKIYDSDNIKLESALQSLKYCLDYMNDKKQRDYSNELKYIMSESLTIISQFGVSEAEAKDYCKLDYNNQNNKLDEFLSDKKAEEEAIEYKQRNPFEFSNTSLTSDGDYVYYKGSIKNVSDTTYSFVEIRATYYDSTKNVITTDITYAVGNEGIRPNESKEFEIMTKVSGEVASGNIEIFDYK